MKEPLIKRNMVNDEIRADFDRIRLIPISDPRMKDARREIHEENNAENQSSVQTFDVIGNAVPMGNHYHKKVTEVFFILSGRVERLITNDVAMSHRREFSDLPPGTMILMPPGVAHAFFLKPGSTMICYATERFDPEDMIPAKLN